MIKFKSISRLPWINIVIIAVAVVSIFLNAYLMFQIELKKMTIKALLNRISELEMQLDSKANSGSTGAPPH